MARPRLLGDVSPLMHCGIVVRHPEHARFFAPIYHRLTDLGHGVDVFVREHRHATDLLDATGVPYDVLAGESHSRVGLVAGHAAFEARLLRAARGADLDVLTAVGGLAISHVAPLAGARSVAFVDWEAAGRSDRLVATLADVVPTPRFVGPSFGESQVRYEGFHELAYLHADRFEPSRAAVEALDVDGSTPTFVLGFLDDGERARTAARDVATLLDGRGDVVLAAESLVPEGFDGVARAPAVDEPDVLARADLYVGNAGTAAAEAAVLGTPAVRLTRPGDADPRCEALAERYQLLRRAGNPSATVGAVEDLLADGTAGRTWARRRDALVSETVDVAALAAGLVADAATPGGHERARYQVSAESTWSRSGRNS